MTAEELAERIRERKERLRKITVEQAIACNLVYDRLGGLPISIEMLDKDQAKLSEIILGGDTDQAINCDLVYESLEGLPINVDSLSKEQLSAIILKGGDTDQVVGVDRSADRG